MWTNKRTVTERIYEDKDFFDSKIDNVRHFFIYGILPEIVGKWYTRIPVADADHIVPLPTANSVTDDDTATTSTDDHDADDDGRLWCYCNQPSFGDMVMCDNKNCTIQWFHFDCLQIRCPPKGKWYCPSCQKLPKFNKRKKQKQ